jgi:hypothetical protein
MGIQINGQTDTITAVDGGLIVSGADFTGVSAGSTSAPSISPTGDSNTGIFFPSADTISVATGGSQRLRVTSTGRVVVKGPSNPSDYTLSDGIFVQPDNGLSGLTIATGSATNNSYLNFSKGTASNAEQFDFALGRDGTNNRGMVKIADNDVAFFTSNGIAFPNGKGIDFSATANSSGTMTSELLADYEEGTWTPAITGSTSGTVNSGNRIGTYTKIGRLVTARFTFVNPSATTISGTWRLTGLPFSGRASSEYVGGYVHYNRNINKAGDWLSIFQESTSGITYFRVMGNYMNGTETYDISGNWPADVLFAGTIFYEAA